MVKKILDDLFLYGGNFIYSIFIVITGLILIKLINNAIDRWQSREKKIVIPINQKRIDTTAALIKSVLRYFIYFIIIVLVLEKFNIPIKTLLAVAGIGGVAIGFGAQSLIKDLIAGLFLIIEDQLAVGDYITIDSKSGYVIEMGLKTIKIQDFNGSIHIIPNGSIGTITNWSRTNSKVIVDIKVNINLKYNDVCQNLQSVFEEIKNKYIDDLVEEPKIIGIIDTNWIEYTIRIIALSKPLKHWEIEREMKKIIIEKLYSK
ncbi:mechanosensitive ion channel family protein [Caldicellulosiruptoraceae bacterium PP1]